MSHLKFKEIQLGLISAVKARPKFFSSYEKNILPDLIKHMAVSFANVRLYNLAPTDDLITLYTKGFFESRIKDFERDIFRQEKIIV